MHLAAVIAFAITLGSPVPVSVAAAESVKDHQHQEATRDLEEQHAQWKDLESAFEDRVHTLQRLIRLLTEQYAGGAVDFSALYHPMRQLHAAEYELARVFRTEEQRRKTLQNNLRLAKSTLEIADARYQAGAVSEADVLQAKSLVADARIAILRDRMVDGGAFPRAPGAQSSNDNADLPATPNAPVRQ